MTHLRRADTRTLKFISIWLDERIIPAYVVAISLLILAIQGVVHSKPAQKLFKNTSEQDAAKAQSQGTWLSGRGGPVIVAFKSTRLAIIIGLFVLILVPALQNDWSWHTCAVVSSLVRVFLVHPADS